MAAADPSAIVGTEVEVGPSGLAPDTNDARAEFHHPRAAPGRADLQPGPVTVPGNGIPIQIRSTFHGATYAGWLPSSMMDERRGSQGEGGQDGDGQDDRTSVGPDIAGYQITALLGRGAFGIVYRAWQPAFHRQVAIKVLMDTLDDRDAARASYGSARPWARHRPTPTS